MNDLVSTSEGEMNKGAAAAPPVTVDPSLCAVMVLVLSRNSPNGAPAGTLTGTVNVQKGAEAELRLQL